MALNLVTLGLLEAIGQGEESTVKFFNSWNEEVKSSVPKSQLLVFNVKEGWEPLCKFLDVPLPDEPFPRVNDTATFVAIFERMKMVAQILFLGLPFTIGLLAFAIYYFYSFP